MTNKTILEQFYLSRKIRVYKDYSPTLRSERFGLLVIENGGLCRLDEEREYKIRKLTPRECFRLMGLTSEDCDKASSVGVSNSQLYRQAGNGIVTNCVELLFEHLYKAQYDSDYTTYDENFTRAVTA